MKRYLLSRKILVLVSFTLILFSCSAPKKVVTPMAELPQWVQQPPISDFYYTGLGSVEKTPYNVNDYRENAKKSALSEISSAISVDVKSKSSLSQTDSQEGFSHNFQSQVVTESTHRLEGVELVDSWENDNVYWAYYRLSKVKYQEQQRRNSEQAIETAEDAASLGDSSYQQGDLNKAMKQWSKALVAYLTYKDDIERLGLDTKLDQTIWNKITQAVSKMRWQSPPSFSGVRGTLWDSSMRRFVLWNADENRLSSIPVAFSIEGGHGLQNFQGVTNAQGEVVVPVSYISSPNPEMKLIVKVDLKRWIRQLTMDINIRKQVAKLNAITGTTLIRIDTPKMDIHSLGKDKWSKKLDHAWRQKIQQDGLCIISSKNIHYRLNLNLRYTSSRNAFGSYTVNFTGEVIVKNRQGAAVWQYTIERCSGVSIDQEEAYQLAYKKLVQWLDYRAYPRMLKSLHLK